MRLTKYTSLTLPEQIKIAYDGLFIAERHYKTVDCKLYYLDDYFVEIIFDNHSKSIRIRPFRSQLGLKPYIEQISIRELDRILM